MQNISFEDNEKIIFELRSLYDSYGYSHYKMSKFEEYDLYSRNKDFLESEGIITFTDTNGKLMALKPDVTLSIIKNTEKTPGKVQKLYYNENVYRVAKSSHSFRELMQVGLECIGEVGTYCICEVLTLAVESLLKISSECILDISSVDILSQVIDYLGVSTQLKNEILKLTGEKNIHEITKKCRETGVEEEKINILRELISVHGTPDKVFALTDNLLTNIVDTDCYSNFKKSILSLGHKEVLNIDFSVTADINYYNGIVFKGFIKGIPNSVISGGQYDTMMKKMNRSDRAIGFAVYTDMLERLFISMEEYDTDILFVYGDNSDLSLVMSKAQALRTQGYSVLVLRDVPENIRYKKLIKADEVNL